MKEPHQTASGDASIARRAIGGDPDALQLLLAAHYDRLLALVWRSMPVELKSVAEPADVVQETLFRAARGIAGLRSEEPEAVFGWLAAIARNTLLNLLETHRAAKRGRRAESGGGDDSVVADRLHELAVYRRTPSRSAAAHEFMSALEQSLLRLPEDYRRAVTLRHVEGLSIEETARTMQRTSGAVAMLCNRAMHLIREDLQSRSHFI